MLTRKSLGILFLQLYFASSLDSITIKNTSKIATQRHLLRAPSTSVELAPPQSPSFAAGESIPRKFFEIPSNVLQVPRHDRSYEFNTRRDEIGATRIGPKSSAPWIGPFVWGTRGNGAQPGRAYLPPVRNGNPRTSYDHLGILPIEAEVVKLLAPARHSGDSIATISAIDLLDPKILATKEKKHHLLVEDSVPKRNNAPITEDIRPVYEKSNENDGVSSLGKKNRDSVNREPIAVSTSSNSGDDSRVAEYRDEITRDTITSSSTLDWFLTKGGYNSQLHPPPDPILALVLSHYGRYLPGNEKPKLYSYMAINNIHNNRPFGQYKLSCDEPSDDFRTRS